MKSFSLTIAALIALGSAAGLAQTSASQPSTASSTTTNAESPQRRECRQQAHQLADPQERQRALRECRQEAQNDGAVSAPSSVAPTSAQTPLTVDQPPSVTAPASSSSNVSAPSAPVSPNSSAAPSKPAPEAADATPSADELRQQRRQAREQRRQPPEQGPLGGAAETYPNDGVSQTPQTRTLTTQDNRRNWRDEAGFGSRGQRLQQLEQRVDALERTLQEVLNNQRRLLRETPSSGR